MPLPIPEVHVDAVGAVSVTGDVVGPDAAAKAAASVRDPINAMLQNVAFEISAHRAAGVAQNVTVTFNDRQRPVYSFHGEETICDLGSDVENGKLTLTVNRKTIAEGSFKTGKRDGLWTYWNMYGAKEFEAEYVVGMKHGRWIAWDNAEDGAKSSEGEFRNDKKHGQWKFWGYTEYALKGLPESEITDPLQRALRGLEQARGVGARTVIVEETWDEGKQTGSSTP